MDSLDAKPKRAVSSRGRRKGATAVEVTSAAEETHDERLNIRVKDRTEESLSKKGRIGGIFKETPIGGLLKDGPAEKLKRPLTGMSNLFRRPASRSGRQRDDDTSVSTEPFDRSSSPMPPRIQTPPAQSHDTDFASFAPHVASTQLQGFVQDNLNMKHPHMMTLDQVDVSSLSTFMCLEEEIEEEDNNWGFDYLFTSLSNEMRDDWAQERRME